MNINIESFILGIIVVLVIASAIVGVIGYFKIHRLKQHIDNINKRITDEGNNNYQAISREVENLHKEFTSTQSNIWQITDSRFDKTENKLRKDFDAEIIKLDNKLSSRLLERSTDFMNLIEKINHQIDAINHNISKI